MYDLLKVLFRRSADRKDWLSYWLHRVKHMKLGLSELTNDIESLLPDYKGKARDDIVKELNYVHNNNDRKHYWTERHNKRPIESDVTEGAYKNLLKQRFGISGAKWSIPEPQFHDRFTCFDSYDKRYDLF
jgi:hypothetical protein